MATRAQTPRAPRKKKDAAPTRKSQRVPADPTPKAENPQLKPKNTTNIPNARAKAAPRSTEPEFDPAKQSPSLMTVGQVDKLMTVLQREGYEVIGPTARDGAITYERVKSIADLPAGWTDEQEPGRYRLKKRDDQALFGYSLGAQSWKKHLHAAEVRLWAAEKQNGSFRILNNEVGPALPKAFLGLRACELAAIAKQDRILLGDKYRDPIYAARRENVFIIAAQCTHSAATCFCASMGSGPKVTCGFDLLLTELVDVKNHRFLVEAGSARGAQFLSELETVPVAASDMQAAETAITSAAKQQRKIDTQGLKEFLYENFENPQWDKVAARCLSCANCTMACPTCFCTTVEDATDISGTHAERWRRWDSCFTLSFSYIHGGSIRNSAKSRYRQWMTHKLAAWTDQFGESGCVGCGRCITWCPAAIDITEETGAMREGAKRADS
jgi:sulfhydrogenase subunit beta (sulfur reductase)